MDKVFESNYEYPEEDYREYTEDENEEYDWGKDVGLEVFDYDER